jgi:hypothetical protein
VKRRFIVFSLLVIPIAHMSAGGAYRQSLQPLTGSISGAQSATRPLTQRGLENLVAFTRLLGYVRHFHPSDEAANAPWDALAVEGALTTESSENPEALLAVLTTFFRPLAPSLELWVTGTPPAPEGPRQAMGTLGFLSWQHRGYAGPGLSHPLIAG